MPLNVVDTRILAMIEAMRNRLTHPDQSRPASAPPDEALIDTDILQQTFPIEASRTPSREAPGPGRESSRSRTRRQAGTVPKTPARSGTPDANDDSRNCKWTGEMVDELWRGILEAQAGGHQ